jgi:hypothetical protein
MRPVRNIPFLTALIDHVCCNLPFERNHCLFESNVFNPEEESCISLRNICARLLNHIVHKSRSLQYENSLPLKPENLHFIY